MARAAFEVAGIFHRHGAAYRAQHRLPLEQHRLMRAIEICRTAALGGHVERCGHCPYQRISYNSCRNRHCPKCQNLERGKWLARRKGELLPVEYFHVVFTIPEQLNRLALGNKETVYKILFQTSAETLQTIARDPKHLGAEIGFFSILHTWGQNLLHHPHVHCVATGGGLSPDRKTWIGCRPGFFLSVRVLSRLFRRLFLQYLDAAFVAGELQFFTDLAGLKEPEAFRTYLAPLRTQEWIVFAKRPFAGPIQVLAYLARYTHRVAIANSRLLDLDDHHVSFRWKDYRENGASQRKAMRLAVGEFMRRFLLHVLPDGFHRIRHYGLFANGHRADKLVLCRTLLNVPAAESDHTDRDEQAKPAAGFEPPVCPCCGGQMRIIETFDGRYSRPFHARRTDSS